MCNIQGPMSRSRKLIWIAAGFVLLAAISLAVFELTSPVGSPTMRFPIVLNIATNGLPSIWGVPLGNGLGRDIAFKALGAAKAPVAVRVTLRDGGFLGSNFWQTVTAMDNAGLTRKPAPPSGPSPFE